MVIGQGNREWILFQFFTCGRTFSFPSTICWRCCLSIHFVVFGIFVKYGMIVTCTHLGLLFCSIDLHVSYCHFCCVLILGWLSDGHLLSFVLRLSLWFTWHCFVVSTSDVRQMLPLTLHSLAEQLPDLTDGGIKIEPWILIRKHLFYYEQHFLNHTLT